MSTSPPDQETDHSVLGRRILLGMVAGVVWGFVARAYLGGEIYVGILGLLFKSMLKMLIVPLVLASIVTGITGLGDVRALGRIGKRTLGFYLGTTLTAVVLGLTIVNLIGPGRGADAESLQVRLEVSQGMHKKLLTLAEDEAEAGRYEASWILVTDYLQRYAPVARDEARAGRAKALRERVTEPPPERAVGRRTEARERWAAVRGDQRASMTIGEFMVKQVDKLFTNPFQALAQGEILAIIVFALLLGACLTTVGEVGVPLIRAFEGLNAAMMRLTDLIMEFAPLGVFALLAEVIAAMGVDALEALAAYMVTVLLGLFLHGFVVLPAVLYFFTGMRPLEFFQGARRAMAISFTTASSSATLPVSMECAEEELGCSARSAGFVLPLGATVNMDGTALYEAVAALFIAQVFGHDLSLGQQVLVALTATLAAIGAAGIPSAGTVTMAMVLDAVGLPLTGIGMILAVDRVLDMCRTTVNVVGDLAGTVVVDRLERASAAADGAAEAATPSAASAEEGDQQ